MCGHQNECFVLVLGGEVQPTGGDSFSIELTTVCHDSVPGTSAPLPQSGGHLTYSGEEGGSVLWSTHVIGRGQPRQICPFWDDFKDVLL